MPDTPREITPPRLKAGRAGVAVSAALIAAALAAWPAVRMAAADKWIEVKSPHFTVVSNASEGSTRKLVWELEQVRSATAAFPSWTRPDLNKPLSVIAVKDLNAMLELAPRYREQRSLTRPFSVWVTRPEAHYVAIRADIELGHREPVNPYLATHASYIGLALTESAARELPPWFHDGVTAVLSNTIVRDDHVLLGAPIPWNLRVVRERPLLPLQKLLTVTRQSPDVAQVERRLVYEAQSWAFVHFLMFGEEGKRADQLNAYWKLVSDGTEAAAAFADTLGPVQGLEGPFRNYFQGSFFSYRRMNIDVSVERDCFPVRALPPAESASVRASFHAAMNRPVEARAAIAEARKADPNAADSYAAEGLLFDWEEKRDEARAAYAKAVELESTSVYAYHRLASLTWQPNPSRETLAGIEKHLAKAISLNSRYAAAYAWLGETRAALGTGDPMELIRRAISIEPREAQHRLRAARVLVRQGKPAEARPDAQAALALAETDADRREAQELLDTIARAQPGGGRDPATRAAVISALVLHAEKMPALDLEANIELCPEILSVFCREIVPILDALCVKRHALGCRLAGTLFETGGQVVADPVRAAGYYRQACDAGDRLGCEGLARVAARGKAVPKSLGARS